MLNTKITTDEIGHMERTMTSGTLKLRIVKLYPTSTRMATKPAVHT